MNCELRCADGALCLAHRGLAPLAQKELVKKGLGGFFKVEV